MNLTPFRLSTAAGLACGTTIELTATVSTGHGTFNVPLGLAVGSASAPTFESADVPKAIPDLSTVESTLTVSGISLPIAKVTVAFHLTHTFYADLDIFLVGPDGTVVGLTSDNGAGGDNFGASCASRTVFDDDASTAITAGGPPYIGTFRPEQPLSAFAGKTGADVNGTWTLRIVDDAGQDVGTLHCWSLVIETPPACLNGSGECAVATFGDVPVTHQFWAYIEALFETGITGGCGTNPARFCPDSPVTRGQMAVFLLRGVAWPGAANPPQPTGTVFADVALGHQFAAWIEGLFATGITTGCATNPRRYCPDASVTRGQMAVFLLKARHGSAYQPPAPAQQTFGDVPLNHQFAAWIYQLAAEGITSGCGNGNFCPGASVTRGQMAVFLVRTFNLPL
jgi:subtilisin-like proprotein convertase family protein